MRFSFYSQFWSQLSLKNYFLKCILKISFNIYLNGKMPSFFSYCSQFKVSRIGWVSHLATFSGGFRWVLGRFSQGAVTKFPLTSEKYIFLWRYPLVKFNIDYYWNLRNQWWADHTTSNPVNLADLPTQRLILGSSNKSWEENPRGQRRNSHLIPSY